MKTERQRQEETAFATCEHVYRWHFVCEQDKYTFSAVAPSLDGAVRVLNAERPGVTFRGDGCTPVPCAPLARRLLTGGLAAVTGGAQ